ncbi:MAG: hypothetical protein AMS21_10955 [Gemmatimonas sp. SG8_38_2]|nr:MAG: hypothetical protein AMS21_10955 [Gemmatimonas sp. SG8_38_2]
MYRIGVAGLVLTLVAWMPVAGPDGNRVVVQPGVVALAIYDVDVAQESWSWSGRVDRGQHVEIKGINGEVRAERTSGNEVEVRAEKRGKKDDPSTVSIEVVEHENGVTICAVYPSKDEDEPNECRPGGRGKMNVKNNDVSVEFTVMVPAGVDFIGRTVNGAVEALGLDGNVKMFTVNGDIDVSTTGLAQGSTVNGSITVSMDRADWDGKLDFTTVNGSVTLDMPGDLNCDVSVSTVNGHISSDYPLTVEGRFSPRHLKGTIGSGGRALVIKTVNGSVNIRRS